MDPATPEPLAIRVPGNGPTLHAARWPARPGPPIAALVVVHGLGDHLGNHAPMAGELAGRLPLDVVAFDLRGHGRSPGRRGYVGHYDELLADLGAVVSHVRAGRPAGPLYLFGHSMGGALAARAAIEAPAGTFAGLILSSPFLGHPAPVPRWKLAAARVLHRLAPRVTLSNSLDPSQLTRDEASWPGRRADPLGHTRISAPLYFGMLAAADRVIEHAGSLRMPTLVVVGSDDTIASPEASRRFFDRLGAPDRTLLELPGFRHEPYLDLGRERVIDETAAWMAARLTRPGDVRP